MRDQALSLGRSKEPGATPGFLLPIQQRHPLSSKHQLALVNVSSFARTN
jgi:hypothetical protein